MQSLTKLTEVPGGYSDIVPVPVPATRFFTKCRVPGVYFDYFPIFRVFTLQKGRVRVWDVVLVPLVWHGRTELTEVSGTGMNIIQNSREFRVWV